MKLKWYLERLRAMESGEINYRVKELINKKSIEFHIKKNHKNIKVNKLSSESIKYAEQQILNYLNNIDSVRNLANDGIQYSNVQIDVFHNTIFLKDINEKWHGIKKSRPSNFFSWKYNFQDKEYEDVRITWELNRHYFMPYLALKSEFNNDNEKKLIEHYRSWKRSNPFLKGVNWNSSMEVAIRSYQWYWVFSFLINNSNEKEFLKELLGDIVFSINYVNENYSKYSSANNHLLIERMIVLYIVTVFPDLFRKSNEIIVDCRRDLKNELRNQFYDDGLNKEQALHYHAFVMEMWVQLNWMLKNKNQEPIENELLNKSIKAFLSFEISETVYCDYGDNDEGKIIDFLNDYSGYKNISILAKDYINQTSFSPYAKLLLNKLNTSLEHRDFKEEKREEVSDLGGNYIFNDKKVFLHFDVAELGYKSLAAHGHADALSIQLFVNETPIFIDKGTYIYNGNLTKRNYYRSSNAHNTIVYKDISQSEIKGPFLWGKKAKIIKKGCEENDKQLKLIGAHDGYYPYIHTREITIEKDGSKIEINDIFKDKFIAYFHLSPNVTIKRITDKILLIENLIYFESSIPYELIKTPFSPKFGVEGETNTIKIASENSLKVCINHEVGNEN